MVAVVIETIFNAFLVIALFILTVTVVVSVMLFANLVIAFLFGLVGLTSWKEKVLSMNSTIIKRIKNTFKRNKEKE